MKAKNSNEQYYRFGNGKQEIAYFYLHVCAALYDNDPCIQSDQGIRGVFFKRYRLDAFYCCNGNDQSGVFVWTRAGNNN